MSGVHNQVGELGHCIAKLLAEFDVVYSHIVLDLHYGDSSL